MLVSIRLDEEEKFQVLLVAFCLFLLALLVSTCLALAACPLNRWLLARHEKRRRQRQELAFRQHRQAMQSNAVSSQQSYYANYHNCQQQAASNKSASLSSYLGPPPAYEAALRATRLQSLTGTSSLGLAGQTSRADEQEANSPDWLKTALANQAAEQVGAGECQLDLGDYFHPPKEPLQLASELISQNAHQRAGAFVVDFAGPQQTRPRAPVMLRLWVKLLEPGELVRRARVQSEAGGQRRRRSMSRQLSIPQLFGSLMTLAGGGGSKSAPQMAICDRSQSEGNQAGGPGAGPDELKAEPPPPPAGREEAERRQQQAGLSSLSSTSTSTSNSFDGPAEQKERPRPAQAADEPTRAERRPARRRHSLPSVNSITSRVLHMNVASFSYVKDENLISTKKHNQMNFHHFYEPAGRTATGQKESKREGKMCQLLVSICDIENLLNSSALQQRACLRLAQNSSIYIKCEILAPKSARSAATRLLRNPLKVLTHQDSISSLSNGSHTISFASTIPAAAMDPTPSIAAGVPQGPPGGGAGLEPAGSGSPSLAPSESVAGQESPVTNWRHEPSADGKSIVVFDSIPKQIAQQQQLACASLGNATTNSNSLASSATGAAGHSSSSFGSPLEGQPIDLVQFDSVFVSPILAKSLLEEGHIRLRVYSQCKYVNETCLAELKLPLKQLMRTQTRDNLGDALRTKASESSQTGPLVAHQQADLILDNLLANLVTASTGSPLSILIEQISAEERAEEEKEATGEQAPGERNFKLTDWLSSSANEAKGAGPNLARTSNSLGASLDELRQDDEQRKELWPSDCDKLIEQNYCRSLMVSHWLNYLVAPSYECQLVEEPRGHLLLGLTYLPTSNRLIFNAHKATLELDNNSANLADKQLVKKLRLQSDTSYLLRFLMIANGRILKRKQTACSRKPEWDSQEPVTFDLVSVPFERPSFVVALVMRNPHALACQTAGGSLQSLTSYHQLGAGSALEQPPGEKHQRACCQSDPESVRLRGGALYRQDQELTQPGQQRHATTRKPRRDLVIGHFVLDQELWHELKAQPRRQLVKRFKLL